MQTLEEKRLWLAGTLAAGMCANGEGFIAENAVMLADQILEELNKENEK